MMKKYIFFILLICCSFTSNNGLRTINNKLYSINIPFEWKPISGMPGDGINPGEREINGFHLFYWAWSTPIKSKEDIPKTIGIDIQSYQKADNKISSVKEIEQLEMSLVSSLTPVKKTNIKTIKDQKLFFLIKDSKEMDGEIITYRVYYLFQQSGKIVHCIKISLRNKLAEQSDMNEKIKKIFTSFNAKNNFLH